VAARGKDNAAKTRREEEELALLLSELPLNPIEWGIVVRLVAPIIARLAVRYALKRLDRGMSEEKVNAVGRSVADFIGEIVRRRSGGSSL